MGPAHAPNAAAIADDGKRRLVQGLRDLAYSETRGAQDLDTLYHRLDCEGLCPPPLPLALSGASSLLGLSFARGANSADLAPSRNCKIFPECAAQLSADVRC